MKGFLLKTNNIMDNCISESHESQNQLVDGSNDWDYRKTKNLELYKVYKRLKIENKAFRIKNCGTYLEFKRFKNNNDFKLHTANFCKQRLCPMCSWRRSLKIFGQVSRIMEEAKKEKEYRFIFLTLTQRNVTGLQLSDELDKMFKGWKKLTERKSFKKAFIGWFRALEITHDVDEIISKKMFNKKEKYYISRGLSVGDRNPNYDTYHPHFHVILMVHKSYFKKADLYITNDQMIEMWKESMGLDYSPNIDIRAFKTEGKDLSKSIAETAKYTVKDDDVLISDNQELTDISVVILDHALCGRRLVAFGGKLKEFHKKLNLDDFENGDLVNTDSEEIENSELDFVIETYFWHIGYKQYVRYKDEI